MICFNLDLSAFLPFLLFRYPFELRKSAALHVILDHVTKKFALFIEWRDENINTNTSGPDVSQLEKNIVPLDEKIQVVCACSRFILSGNTSY